jgi:hypothetical protein
MASRILNKMQIKSILAKQRKASIPDDKRAILRLEALISGLIEANADESLSNKSKDRNNILIAFYKESIDIYLNKRKQRNGK